MLVENASNTGTLLVQAREGDAEAFGELCQAYEPRLLRQAMLVCGDASVAKDLAQETLVEAWRCLSRYNGQCQFFTWLCAILHNRYRNFSRRKRLWSLLSFTQRDSDEMWRGAEEQPDNRDWPDQTAQATEQAALVRRCVLALPAKQQQVVYLRFFVDDSLEGIAVALCCSVGTVKSRLFHALERLRRMPALHDQRENFPKKIDLL